MHFICRTDTRSFRESYKKIYIYLLFIHLLERYVYFLAKCVISQQKQSIVLYSTLQC